MRRFRIPLMRNGLLVETVLDFLCCDFIHLLGSWCR